MRAHLQFPTLPLVVALLFASGCSDASDPAPGEGGGPPVADASPVSGAAADQARARAAALFPEGHEQDLTTAWTLIEPLTSRDDARAADLLRGAVISFHMKDDPANMERARQLIERAARLTPDDPRVRFVRGNVALALAFEPQHFEREQELLREAAADYRAVLAEHPDDAPTRLQLAEVLDYLEDDAGREEQLVAVRALGLGPNGPHYAQACYQLGLLRLRRSKTPEARAEAMAMMEEKKTLEAAGIENTEASVAVGNLGGVEPPTRVAVDTPGGALPGFVAWTSLDLDGTPHLLSADLDADGQRELLAWGDGGLVVLHRDGDTWSPERVHSRGVDFAALGDLDAGATDEPEASTGAIHAPPELLTIEDGTPLLLSYDIEARRWSPLGLGGLEAGDAHCGVFVDLDHDGDLDIVLGTDRGLEWRRNDGAEQRLLRVFGRERPEPFAGVGAVTSLIIEDVDDNQAVDLLGTTADGGLFAIANRWSGSFEDGTAAWGLEGVTSDATTAAGGLAVGDLDGDGLVDLLVRRADGGSLLPGSLPGFAPARDLPWLAEVSGPLSLADLDRDGRVDLIGAERLVAGPPLPASTPGAPLVDGAVAALVDDLDGDGVLDLARTTADRRLELLRGEDSSGRRALTLALTGMEDNLHAVGAIVELLAGTTYRRIFWRGRPEVIGLGDGEQLDVLTIRWPNGVHHPHLDLPAGERAELEQIPGLTGSCPFLYTWNGETFTFITDVLGTTPLGLPMVPGQHVPFDEEEYVKVRGDQLVPRDGRLDIVLTEELREVTYLDRVRLHAIDHPAATEIEPHEGFVFPPFPPHHVHTFTDVVAPARILASNGDDVTELLGAVDGRHAQPFVHRPHQFMGLTEPWSLDITLAGTEEQRAALRTAPKLRLALTGWLLWGDASVNLAAARHPTIAFEPPMLSVPDGEGGWVATGPPIGFPAGKTKTLVVDVTDLVDRDDPRLRLTTTLALTWDAIRLVVDADDAPWSETVLEPTTAEVAFRGFSARLPDPTGEFGELFDWERTEAPRWDQHRGSYTRYGDVLPLITEVDDRTVIFGAGDAVTISFAADGLPELPAGWTRDWLLYVNGWAKDGDPNTTAAHAVEPLPFHGMSDYPPPAGEAFPDTPELRAWAEEYNTRPGKRLIPRLARTGRGR